MSGFFHGVEVIELDSGIRPIQTVRSSVIGIVGTASEADNDRFPLNEPVLVVNRVEAAKLGSQGTLADALDLIYDQIGAVVVVVRVEHDDDIAKQLANIQGGVDAETEKRTGVHALLDAESKLGVKPRILTIPKYSTETGIVAELIGIAETLKAVIIAEAPSMTDEAAKLYAGNFDSARVYVIDPQVEVLKEGIKTLLPSSPAVAGLIAKIDHSIGWHYSPSNHSVNGITGTERAIEYSFEANSRANLLNEHNVNVIIRQNGWRLWGNRTTSNDPKWQFLCVRRTADMLNESLLYAHQWAVDRGITKTFIDDITMSVNDYLRTLVAQGRILGGQCWVDQTVNTNNEIKSGHITFDFDFTPVYPAERITFRSLLTDDYIDEIF
ncbi:phage tail sheath subtilisin-like domain-containing protein [Thiotrichales bacterium 19S3-7]|nr:phage tail sheath subtilisin-like domain-containing protein [Thiotrichales bacterium 19S3-7]MCF6803021.1 phage tail sheath subtilisin-like domain-containing protein [Thiotrichales bacterium 19S3-11]